MSRRREKPYESTSQNYNQLIDKPIIIPMSQRGYEWALDQIKPVFEDIISIFEERQYVLRMGTVILYINTKNQKENWESQQRFITLYLILLSIGFLYPELQQQIFQKLILNIYEHEITTEHERMRNKYYGDENFRFPKVWCVNPYDNEALLTIVNEIYKSRGQYFTILENNDQEIQQCSICNTPVSHENSFERHLKKKHPEIKNYERPNKFSNIFNAFDKIMSLVKGLGYDKRKIVEFYNFILSSIDFQVYESSNIEYVSRIFEWENNRGKRVSDSDIVKNLLLSDTPEEYRMDVYLQWTQIKSKTRKQQKNYGEKLMNCAIQLYNMKFKQKTTIDDYRTLIDGEKTYSNTLRLFTIAEKLDNLFTQICEDRYGRIITQLHGGISWEGYMFVLLPIFYSIGSINQDLIKLLVKWYIRHSILHGTLTFNSVIYSARFIDISNNVLENRNYTYYNDICKVFENIDPPNIKDDGLYANYVSQYAFQDHKTMGSVLYFYETVLNTNNYIPPLGLTIEHIYPQSKQELLEDKNRINLLGNLTLLEGANSENGHRGNLSLQDKPYIEKKESYKQSGCKMTRAIAKKFPTEFEEAHIISRTQAMAAFLAEQTNCYA